MKTSDWQPTAPFDAIVFDCDGTLSQIEGIDELARINGVGDEVVQLTAMAMAEQGVTTDLYKQRLHRVQPTRSQVVALGKQYFEARVPDVLDVIQLYQRLNKSVYVMSAGVNPAVTVFSEALGVPESHVFAVDLVFDAQGDYLDYDRSSPLADRGGKGILISEVLAEKYTHILHVGDGMNDVAAMRYVTRFVGYGGVFPRERIAALCEFYLRSASLLALLPLSLTQEESDMLDAQERSLYERGLDYFQRDSYE